MTSLDYGCSLHSNVLYQHLHFYFQNNNLEIKESHNEQPRDLVSPQQHCVNFLLTLAKTDSHISFHLLEGECLRVQLKVPKTKVLTRLM